MSSSQNQQLISEISRQQALLKSRLDEEQSALTNLAKRLWAQQESEKARLSRELHDGVGQLLTGLTRRLQSLAGEAPELAELAEISTMALADVRQLSRLMSPTILDDLGLKPALTWLCRSLFEHEPTNYHCSIEITADIPDDIAILLFRVAQEFLVNTIKHSGASQVNLELSQHQHVVRMDIHDNGCGFDKAGVEAGIGLASIEDRARAFNASLTLATSRGKGTRLSLTVPI